MIGEAKKAECKKCKFWENAHVGPSGEITFLPYEKAKILIYWTLLCDQVYGQEMGSKTVNLWHFSPEVLHIGIGQKCLKLSVFDPKEFNIILPTSLNAGKNP